MGIIAEACAKQGHGLAELAAFSGMLESLLVAMDWQASDMPDEISAALDNFCVAREIYLQKTIKSLEFALKDHEGAKAAGVAISYANEEDYPAGEVMPRLVRNHFQEYAASHLPDGMALKIVPFNGDEFRAWLKFASDTGETRLLWAVNVLNFQANS